MTLSCSICTAPAPKPEVGSRPPLCPPCDEIVRRRVTHVLRNRERQRRFRSRKRVEAKAKTVHRVLAHVGRDGFEDWVDKLRPQREVDVSKLPPVPQARLHNGSLPRRSKKPPPPPTRFCTRCLERPLNLGRYKTTGDICGTCKREERAEQRAKAKAAQPLGARDLDDLQRQLTDETPLPDDDDEEAWDRLLAKEAARA